MESILRYERKDAGSIPARGTIYYKITRGCTSVEDSFFYTEDAVGSIPTTPTIYYEKYTTKFQRTITK